MDALHSIPDLLVNAGRLVPFAKDDDADGHWITIGAHGEGDDRHGGTPVFIKDGRIVKGASSLTGKRIDALKEDASDLGTHRQQLKASREHARAVWAKTARKEGHDPKDLHQLAGEMLAHHHASVEDQTAALKAARKTIESYGGDWKSAALRAAHGGDVARASKANKGYDIAADKMAQTHPHLFPDQGRTHNSDRLFELLAAGNPEPMSEEHAYEQAMEELRRYGPAPKEKNYRKGGGKGPKKETSWEDIPFSLDGCGRLVEFGRADQPRVPAGSPEGGEWTSGGAGSSSDPFGTFRKAGPAQSSLFEPRATDVRPREIDQDADLRALSTARKSNPSAWDLPQEKRDWQGGFYITHLSTGKRVESVAGIGGHEYVVRDQRGKHLGKFKTAESAVAFVEGTPATMNKGAPSTLAPAKPGSGKLFDFSEALAGCGRLVQTADFADGGRWVTIEGTHVYIGRGGKIEKGPAHLTGKNVSDLPERQQNAKTVPLHHVIAHKLDVGDHAGALSAFRSAPFKQASSAMSKLSDYHKFKLDEADRKEAAPAAKPAKPAAQPPSDPKAFAREALAAADRTKTGGFGDSKVFINHVHAEMQKQYPGLTLDDFKRRLVEANGAGHLTLSRADLIEAMRSRDVKASETPHPSGTGEFHFILSKGQREQTAPNYAENKEDWNKAAKESEEKSRRRAVFSDDVLAGAGRLADFGSPDQPRVPAGTSEGGQWVSGATSGATATASWAAPVRNFLARDTPATAQQVAALHSHLNSLTVPQLQALRKEHGVRDSLKSRLVRELRDRIQAQREAHVAKPLVMPSAAQTTAAPAVANATEPHPSGATIELARSYDRQGWYAVKSPSGLVLKQFPTRAEAEKYRNGLPARTPADAAQQAEQDRAAAHERLARAEAAVEREPHRTSVLDERDDAQRAVNALAPATKPLPPLQGTEKQIPWAGRIRSEFFRRAEALVQHRERTGHVEAKEDRAALTALQKIDRASFWIDNRDKGVQAILDRQAMKDAPFSLDGAGRLADFAAHKFSSTQLNLADAGYSRSQGSPVAKLKAMAEAIPDADLADDGRENEAHVTVKYGLHTADADAVRKAVKDFGPVEITLGKTSIFAKEAGPQRGGDAYDVVKVDVVSPDLHRLNKLISSSLECTDTHPRYVPHITLAYVKPGLGKKYAGDASAEGKKILCTALVFSDQEGKRATIPLTKGERKRSAPFSEDATLAHCGRLVESAP